MVSKGPTHVLLMPWSFVVVGIGGFFKSSQQKTGPARERNLGQDGPSASTPYELLLQPESVPELKTMSNIVIYPSLYIHFQV